MLIVFTILFAYFLDVCFTELLFRLKVDSFYSRKIGHILGSIIAFFMIDYLTKPQFIIVCILLITVNVASNHLKIFKSIEKGSTDSIGTILFPLTILILGLLYFNNTLIYKSSILVLGFADAMAALIGKKWGKKKIGFNRQKSWEGFFAFALTTLIIFNLTYYHKFSHLDLNLFIISIFLSSFLALLEVISPKGTDNFTIPVLYSTFLKIIAL